MLVFHVYLILENRLLWGKGGGHIKICDIRKFPRFTSLWICILRGKSNFSTPFQWFSQALGHIFLLLPFILVSPLHPKKLSKQQSFRLFSKSMRYRWQFVDGLQTQIKNLAEAAFGCFYHSLFPQHFLNECEFMLPLLFHPFFPLLILLTIECKLRSLHCYTILRILHNLANSYLRLLLC